MKPKPAGLKNYTKWMKKAGDELNENSLAGWINADLFVYTGLKAAGPDFTRQKVDRRDQRDHGLQRRRHPRTGRLDQAAHGQTPTSPARSSRRSSTASSSRCSARRASRSSASRRTRRSCRRTPRTSEPGPRWSARARTRRVRTRDRADRLRHPGHPVRLRLRAGRDRPRPHLQDVGGLQPRVRRAGVRVGGRLLRAPGRATSGRSSRRSSSRSWSWRRSSGSSSTALLFRHLRTAPAVAKLVTSLGSARRDARDREAVVRLQRRVRRRRRSGPTSSGSTRSATTCSTATRWRRHRHRDRRCVGLTVLFRYTTHRPAMRAVVESPRMTELAGINADRVEHVLLDAVEPLRRSRRRAHRAAVRPGGGGQLHDPAGRRHRGRRVRAAHEHPDGAARRPAARHRSRAILAGYLPLDSILAQGCGRRCRSWSLFLLLLFWPGLRQQTEITDPLAGRRPAARRPRRRAARDRC